MFYRINAYLLFLKKSGNEHGVHSPFVFDLLTKCFYKKTDKPLIEQFISIKKELLESKDKISVEDFGAGSKVFKNGFRSVSDIVKVVSLKKKNAFLLIRLVKYLKIKKSLEIGTSLGLGTTCLSLGAPDSQIKTLEGCRNTSRVAKNSFDLFKLKNIELVVGEFSKTLPEVLKNSKYDLVYFDGNHTKKATLSYFYQALETIHNDTVFIFDDIHWSLEMEEAWEVIKMDPTVKVTIDTFFWGIVFFRKEQAKEHFVIRV